MIDRRILSLIGLFGVSALLQKVQCNYAEPINLHDLKTTSLTSSSGSDGGAGRSRCLLQNVIDMRQSYDSIAAVADASDGAATSTSLKPSADENSMETNAHIYNGHYQRDNIQTIRYKTLNIQGTGNSKSKTLAYSPSKGEILVHRPAAIVVKRPPTKVIVNHPPLVVKPPPVVLHKPPAVVVRKVYVKEHPRPVKVEPVYVNVVKPPAEKYFVNEKQQSNVRHHDEQHEQLQHLTQQEYLQQHQYEAEPLSTGISYKPLTIAANSNAHPHHYRVETMTSALKHDDSYYHMTSADNSELNRLLHTENSNKDGDANYDIPPSISLSKMQHDTNASSY